MSSWLLSSLQHRKEWREKSEKVRAVIVRCAKEYRREDGSYIRFDDNAAVILDADGSTQRYPHFRPGERAS